MSTTETPKGHPPGLYVLFFAEMWERFCYYGMRALLVLYLTKALLMQDGEAIGIYGAYTALVYAAPVVGGRMADSLLGYRRAVVLGGLLMACGEFMLLAPQRWALFAGMGLIIVGNGYFKANISSIVGKLYPAGDPRRDSGFTIFYMGINIGAFLATTVCAGVGEAYGYQYGFGLAGIGMLIGVVTFIGGQKLLQGHGDPPDVVKLNTAIAGPLTPWHLTILGSLGVVPILYFLLQNEWLLTYLLVALMLVVLGNLVYVSLRDGDNVQRDRIIVLIVLIVFNVAFWACFEQAGSSLTLFADRAVDRSVGGFEITASQTQSFNAGFIVLLGGIFSAMWVYLHKKNLNPSIPMKFALGIIQLGLGFLVVSYAGQFVDAQFRAPLVLLVLMYLLHTTGELFLSPIGLSMVTKLAPEKMTGTVMGAWFLGWAMANLLAAKLAVIFETPLIAATRKVSTTSIGKALESEWFAGQASAVLGNKAGMSGLYAQAKARAFDAYCNGAIGHLYTGSPQHTLEAYTQLYQTIAITVIVIGVLLLALSGRLNKLMHGVT